MLRCNKIHCTGNISEVKLLFPGREKSIPEFYANIGRAKRHMNVVISAEKSIDNLCNVVVADGWVDPAPAAMRNSSACR